MLINEGQLEKIQGVLGSGFFKILYNDRFQVQYCEWANPLRQMLGFQGESDQPGTPDDLLSIVHEEDKSMLQALFQPVGEGRIDIEYRVKDAENECQWYRMTGTIIPNEEESAYAAVGVMINTTLRKHTEQRLDHEKRHREEEYKVLTSVAGIYLTMHKICFRDNTSVQYSTTSHVDHWFSQSKDARKQMYDVMTHVVRKDYLDKALEFTDLDTVVQRMGARKMISTELVSNHTGWFRAAFIEVERDARGQVETVLFTTQVINDEKRREEELLLKSTTDKLTSFYNRRAYEEDMTAFTYFPPEHDFVYISMDLNNLKRANDQYGHQAGDELIQGAAYCIDRAFGSFGKTYRVGGDEFAALLYIDERSLQVAQKDFAVACEEWRGEKVSDLAISIGCASRKEFPELSINELAEVADNRMYDDKAAYYERTGIERRRH